MRLDGSDGEPDYRFHIEDVSKCGTFHRDNDALSCIMGTLEQAGEGAFSHITDKSLSFFACFPDAKVLEGFTAVRGFLETAFQKAGTFAIRDTYHCWSSLGKTFKAGKPFLFVPSRDSRQHEMFFDDNAFGETPCVHPMNMCDLEHEHPPDLLRHTHVCCVQPLDAIARPDYFVSAVRNMEVVYTQLLRDHERLALFHFTCGYAVSACEEPIGNGQCETDGSPQSAAASVAAACCLAAADVPAAPCG